MRKSIKPNTRLLNLWRKLTVEQRKQFATLTKKTPGSLRHVVEGRRGISSDLAIRIEKATIALGVKTIERTELNATCRNCEYAKACAGDLT